MQSASPNPGHNHGHDPANDPATWPTLREAAAILGISHNAVRQRMRRDSYPAEKIDGTWRVNIAQRAPGQANDQATADPASPPAATAATDQAELVAELRDRIRFLEQQLHTRAREVERRDVIILNLSESLKALPAPQEQRNDPQPIATPSAPQRPKSGRSWRFWER